MEKPVIYLQKYEIEEIKLLRHVDISADEKALNLDLNIGTTESKKEGKVVLSSKILDIENNRELFIKLAGYFEINIDKIGDENPSKFSQSFKKYLGILPRQYRNMNSERNNE